MYSVFYANKDGYWKLYDSYFWFLPAWFTAMYLAIFKHRITRMERVY